MRRKLWWIVSALIGAFALFVTIAFLVDNNSPDARVKRAVAQIAEEHGLELRKVGAEDPGKLELGIVDEYWGSPIDEERAALIVSSLRDACPSFKYDQVVLDEDGGNPGLEMHVLVPIQNYEGVIDEVFFMANDKGINSQSSEPIAFLTIAKSRDDGLWQTIENLWPW